MIIHHKTDRMLQYFLGERSPSTTFDFMERGIEPMPNGMTSAYRVMARKNVVHRPKGVVFVNVA